MAEETVTYLEVGRNERLRRIAVRSQAGQTPGLFWLSGFRSVMTGTKAQALAGWARQHGRALVRFDYSGHGELDGAFAAGTIGRWLEESLAVFSACARGPQVVVGSSMGAWLALLLARALRQRPPGPPSQASLAGLVLIAPAVDFTRALIWPQLSVEARHTLMTTGSWERPSRYDDGPYLITKALIEEAENHLLLNHMIETGCPVRILQGVEDPDVPWQHAIELVARLAQDDVIITLVKDGDHRLSRPEDLQRLIAAIEEF